MPFNRPSDPQVTTGLLANLIRRQIEFHFGDFGAGATASTLNIKYFSQVTSTGIIRVAREHYRIVWAAMTFISEILGQPVVFAVQRVSGTIRKAELHIIKMNKLSIRELSSTMV